MTLSGTVFANVQIENRTFILF